jgi:MOSC domain-containing protein
MTAEQVQQSIRVAALSLTPVKATRLHTVGSIELTAGGARGNRVFYLIDGRARMVTAKVHGSLQAVVAEWDEATQRLSLSFPDRDAVEGIVDAGSRVEAPFYAGSAAGEIVNGPWEAALSAYLGVPVRLVRVTPNRDRSSAVDRGFDGAVSLISRGSLQRLAAAGEVEDVDARRFRMLVEVEGIAAHAEDAWVDREVRLGGSTVRFSGNVGRCLITSRNPDTGEVDLQTLDLLRGYRGAVKTTEPLPFGIYGEVVTEGIVRVGDPVTPL